MDLPGVTWGDAANKVVSLALKNPHQFLANIRWLARGAAQRPKRKSRAVPKYSTSRASLKRRKSVSSSKLRLVGKSASKKKAPSKKSSIKKRVSRIEKRLSNLTSKLKYREVETQASTSSNQQVYSGIIGNSIAVCDRALARLRYYNPSVPGTLTTADGSTGTYDRTFKIRGKMVRTYRNNSNFDQHVTWYVYVVKDDTSVSVGSAWSQGLTDKSNTTFQSPFVDPDDSEIVKSLYKKVKAEHRVVKPGDTFMCQHVAPWIEYNPSVMDTQTEAYQKVNQCYEMLCVVAGTIVYSAASLTSAARGPTQYNIETIEELTVLYNSGGPALKYIHVEDGRPSFTDDQQSNQPAPAVQSFV